MVRDIAVLLKLRLSQYYHKTDGIITNLAGLVRIKEVNIGNNTIRKIPFAVDCDTEPQECDGCEPIYDLVPDTPTAENPKRCIVYFEQGKTVQKMNTVGQSSFESIISLVCWFDSRQFLNPEQLTSKLITLFASEIKKPFALPVGNPITSIRVTGYTPIDSDPVIFSKYSYSDFRQPFLGCPNGYFRIDFNLNYVINETCLPVQNPISIDNCC